MMKKKSLKCLKVIEIDLYHSMLIQIDKIF